ncbi:hypothetical protein AB4305_24190 [Nocardia sp. 2YAB30]|uniref:hypothetical protein n=1 Tax=unclassified Nocardia TaxID=2637762 RepID=UPI003F9CDA37
MKQQRARTAALAHEHAVYEETLEPVRRRAAVDAEAISFAVPVNVEASGSQGAPIAALDARDRGA